jgi:hypothetical protein
MTSDAENLFSAGGTEADSGFVIARCIDAREYFYQTSFTDKAAVRCFNKIARERMKRPRSAFVTRSHHADVCLLFIVPKGLSLNNNIEPLIPQLSADPECRLPP